MIYLFVILLGVSQATPAADGITGTYATTYRTYQTIAACESERAALIRVAKQQDHQTLISLCATNRDVVTYHAYNR